jgi:predicted phosphodiesterase
LKIALITDTHWGVRNDSRSFLDYFDLFYNTTFFPYLEDNGIKDIIHLGDIVDRRKFISYTTLRRFKDTFINRVTNDGYNLDVLIGNHDVPYKNSNDINSMAELFDKQDIKYYSGPITKNYDGCDILLMPWINSENYDEAMQAMRETPAQILFGHLEIAGCLMMRGITNEHGLEISDFKQFDTVASGHFHHKNTTQNIHYLGCPYELTWADYQDPKGFHIFDTDTREFEFIRNPYSMFHKIFYSDENKELDEILATDFTPYKNSYVKVVKNSVNNPYWFDKFMDELVKVEPVNIQVVDDHLNLNLEDDSDIVNEAEDTLTILSKHIDGLGGDIPKKELDILMRSLYNEALHMEV